MYTNTDYIEYSKLRYQAAFLATMLLKCFVSSIWKVGLGVGSAWKLGRLYDLVIYSIYNVNMADFV